MSMKEKLKILVVDDAATSRGLITKALDEIGIKNYSWENNGKAALQELSKNPYHMVISDYNMPEMDGLTLLKTIRSSNGGKKVGFVLVTGSSDQRVIDKGKELGMNNYILKPFQTDQLKGCIEAVFNISL